MRLDRAATTAVLAIVALVVTACGGAPGTAGSPTPAAQFSLTRPAEFVISTGPGGGSDIYARQMQAIVEQNRLTSQPLNPINKEGGSGAVAFNYVFEKRGDPHYVMITLNSFFLTMAIQKLPYQATDFTPIANLALDPFFLWVRNDSPWKTAQDFVNAAKAGELTVSGTGSKQEDEVLFRTIEEIAGTRAFRYVPLSGGGAVAAALAGGQGGTVATVNNPSEGLPLYQGADRKVRPICAFLAASPTEGPFKDLPTCQSQGLNIQPYFNTRAIMAAPGISPEAQAFWVDVFRKVADSQTWKDFVSTNNLNPDFKSGAEFTKLIQDLDKQHREIAQKHGWIQ